MFAKHNLIQSIEKLTGIQLHTRYWNELMPENPSFDDEISQNRFQRANGYIRFLVENKKSRLLFWAVNFAMNKGIPLYEAIQWTPLIKSSQVDVWYDLIQSMPEPKDGWFLRGYCFNYTTEQALDFIGSWLKSLNGCSKNEKMEFLEFLSKIQDKYDTDLSCWLLLAKMFGIKEVSKGYCGYELMMPIARLLVNGKKNGYRWQELKGFLQYVLGDKFYTNKAMLNPYSFNQRLFQVFFYGLNLDEIKSQHNQITSSIKLSPIHTEWVLSQFKNHQSVDLSFWQPFIDTLGENRFMEIFKDFSGCLLDADFMKKASYHHQNLYEFVVGAKQIPQ